MITSIDKLQPIITTEITPARGTEETGGGFLNIFQTAIDAVKETDAEKTEAEYLLATGQLDNPSALVIAATKNQIAVELLVQLRNKALDVYSELTRLSM